MAIVQKLLSVGILGGGGLGLCLTHQFYASSQVVAVPIAVAGSFRNWRLKLATTPGEDITRTIRKNGADTALSLFFTSSDTLKTDSDSVAFAAGDLFVIGRIGNPSVGCASMLEWVPDDGESQLYSFAAGTFVSGRYLGVLNTGNDGNATEASVSSLVGVDGTVTVLRVACGSDPGGGKSRVYTLYKNGVAQDGTGGTVDTRATITSGNTTASASFSLSVVAGDRLSLRCDGTGGATDDDMAGSIAFVGATETVMYGGATSNAAGTTAGTSFRQPFSWSSLTPDAGVAEDDFELFGADGLTIGGMRIYLPTAPSSGQSRAFTLRKNAVDTALTVTLSDTTQAGVVTASGIAIGYSDEWSLEETRTGTPASTVIKYVFTTGSPQSRNNFLTGARHETQPGTISSAIFGEDGLVGPGERNVLFSLCGESPGPTIEDEDGVFKVCAEKIVFDAPEIIINDEPYGEGGGSGGSPSLTLDGLSDVVITSPVDDGDVLTYDSSSGLWINEAPTGGSPSGDGGGLVLLDSQTASASASLIFALSASYDSYVFKFSALIPATNSVTLLLTVSVDGGSNYLAGTTYTYYNQRTSTDGGADSLVSAGAASLTLAQAAAGNIWESGTNESLAGTLNLYHVNAATYKFADGMILTAAGSSGAIALFNRVAAGINTASAITHVKFASSSGNIASGTIRLYGFANS